MCPQVTSFEIYLPLDPEPATEEWQTALDAIGMWLNGTAIFNWGDGQSFNNEGIWNNSAAEEQDAHSIDRIRNVDGAVVVRVASVLACDLDVTAEQKAEDAHRVGDVHSAVVVAIAADEGRQCLEQDIVEVRVTGNPPGTVEVLEHETDRLLSAQAETDHVEFEGNALPLTGIK